MIAVVAAGKRALLRVPLVSLAAWHLVLLKLERMMSRMVQTLKTEGLRRIVEPDSSESTMFVENHSGSCRTAKEAS